MSPESSELRVHWGVKHWLALVVAISCILVGRESVSQEDARSVAASAVPGDYLIGPLDTLNVFVMDFPEYSVPTVPVRPDGKITTPLVEDMIAVGKSPTQLARDIEVVLAEYVRTPRVTVSVAGFVGEFGTQIRVLGQLARPGQVPYRNGVTLLDVMLEVGGLTEFASGRRATLTRTVDGVQTVIPIRLDRLLERGDLSENLPMQPGDVVHVPQAVF